MQNDPLTTTHLLIAWHVLRKHKGKILTLVLVTVVTVAMASLLATPVYRASSRLLVKPGREDIYVTPTGGSQAVYSRASGENQKLNSAIEILKSPALAHALVERFGAERLYDFPDRTLKARLFPHRPKQAPPPREDIYAAVEKSLDASVAAKSNVINVTFRWPDPTIAADALNTLVGLFRVHYVEVHTDHETYRLIRDQVEKREDELRRAEAELEELKARHAITSFPQQKTILLERLSEVETQIFRTESELAETGQIIASLESQLAEMDPTIQLNETTNKQSATLSALKNKLVELELQGLRDEVEHVRRMIAEEEKRANVIVVSGKSPIRQSLQTDLLQARSRLRAIRAKLQKLKAQQAQHQEDLKGFMELENRLKGMERQVDIHEANYKLYHTKFEEAKISESMDQRQIASLSVIEPAHPPIFPVKPRKKLYVAVGGALALLFGAGLAFLLEFINPVFRTRDDVDRFLGLPVLAVLPKEAFRRAPLRGNP